MSVARATPEEVRRTREVVSKISALLNDLNVPPEIRANALLKMGIMEVVLSYSTHTKEQIMEYVSLTYDGTVALVNAGRS